MDSIIQKEPMAAAGWAVPRQAQKMFVAMRSHATGRRHTSVFSDGGCLSRRGRAVITEAQAHETRQWRNNVSRASSRVLITSGARTVKSPHGRYTLTDAATKFIRAG